MKATSFESSQHPYPQTRLIALHLSALLVSIAYIYLAWDGGQVIQHVVGTPAVPVYSEQVYRAIYAHYFPGRAHPDWSPLSFLVGYSNVYNCYLWAPITLMVTTILLGRWLRPRWRWLVIGLSLIVVILLVWLAPSLRQLAVILD